jgi:hypothetical protein
LLLFFQSLLLHTFLLAAMYLLVFHCVTTALITAVVTQWNRIR